MAIIVDAETRLVVQGLTGSEGRFHGLRNREYGTELVAGVVMGRRRDLLERSDEGHVDLPRAMEGGLGGCFTPST